MSWACGTSWFGWAYQVYRIDTTNVANIELVPNITYVSSTVWTYIVDDDIVINGWYFLNNMYYIWLCFKLFSKNN